MFSKTLPHWGAISQFGDTNGSFSFSSTNDVAHWLWTYVYVKNDRTLNVPYTDTEGTAGVWISQELNNPFSQYTGSNSVGRTWNLKKGYNRIDFTTYNQNQSFSTSLNYALANNVEIMSSAPKPFQTFSADFNSDGLSDTAIFTPAAGELAVSVSDGKSFQSSTNWIQNFGKNSTIFAGHFDNNGHIDLVSFDPSSGTWKVALSDGTKLIDNGTWLNFYGKDELPGVGDFNGDGLTDIYKIYTVGIRKKLVASIALNTGSGFSPWTAIPFFDLSSDISGKTFAADFNGDGLTDFGSFSKSTGNWVIRLNQGDLNKRFDTTQFMSGFGANNDMVVTDFNDDDFFDIGYYEYSSGNIHYRAFDGNRFGETKILTLGLSPQVKDIQFQAADYNGDGITDFGTQNTIGLLEIVFSDGEFTDLLASVSNNMGGVTSIDYSSSINKTNTFLPFNVPLVKSVTNSNSRGDQYATDYDYAQGLWDASNREFRGFGFITVTDPEGSYSEQIYLQDDIFKGRLKEQKNYDHLGKLLSKAVSTWDVESIFLNTNFVFLKRTDKFMYDGDSTGWRTAEEFFYEEIPQSGNLTKTVQLGEVDLSSGADIGRDRHTVEMTYINNLDTSLLGLPSLVTTKDVDNTTTRKTWFSYDPKGLLIQKEDWAGDEPAVVNPKTQYTYDSYGNLLTTTDPLGNTTAITYDTQFHMFPISTQNVIGHTVVNTYYGVEGVALDNGDGFYGIWGQLKSTTDPNEETGQRGYDPFGRLALTVSPEDSLSYPTQTTDIEFLSEHTKITTHNRINHGQLQTIETVQFFDGLGRLIQTKTPSGTLGQYVVRDQAEYNSRGFAEKIYLPYSMSTPLHVMDAIDSSQPHTTLSYDAVGRVIQTTHPDGRFTTVQYNDKTTRTFDESGHKQESDVDIYGRLIEKREYTGADGRDSNFYPMEPFTLYATTQYTYDISGNLIQTQDQQGNTTNITYDKLGRKIKMDDPDMGIWTYEYDLNGNLIEQMDAKGQKITFTYDALNRLVNKTDGGDLDVNYTYDDASVSHSKGKLTQADYTKGDVQFIYDPLGREIQSIKKINNQAYNVQRDYDALNSIVKIQYPNTKNMYYGYNAAGQVVEISNQQIIPAPPIIDPPVLNTVVVENQGVSLDWTSVDNAEGYKIKYGTSKGSYIKIIDVGNVHSFNVTGLSGGLTYYFVVIAYDIQTESQNSNEVNTIVLDAPTLNVSVGRDKNISLGWTSVNNAEGYKIKYGTSENNKINIIDVGNTTNFVVAEVNNGTTYYFVVSAYNGQVDGPTSNQRNATPQPPPVPLFPETKLLLLFDGQNIDAALTDTSKRHTIIPHKNPELDFTDGKFSGTSLSFNSKTFLHIDDSPDWDIVASPIQDWTIDLWVKHRDLVSPNYYVVHKSNSSNEWQLGHRDKLEFSAEINFNRIISVQGGKITDNEWHHVALVKVGDKYGLYLDGKQTGYRQTENTFNYMGGLYIGEGPHGGSYENLNGSMDNLRIVNRNIFNAAPGYIPSFGPSDNIIPPSSIEDYIAQRQIDETSGNNAADTTGNGNNGTLFNMTNTDQVSTKINNGLNVDGVYETRMFSNNSFEVESKESFIVGANPPLLFINKTTYAPNEAITVTFFNALANSSDWIGLFSAGSANTSNLGWYYTDGTKTGTTGIINGRIAFDSGLPPGDYEVRILFNDSFKSETAVSFKIVSPDNTAPTANSQNGLTTNQGTDLAITLTGGDADGDTLTYVVITQPTNGSLSGVAPNLIYSSNLNYVGADSFTFKVNDGTADSNVVKIRLDVLTTTSINTFIGHWNFDETSGNNANDATGNGNNGTLFNMTNAAWVSGKINNGLDFDGTNDYVAINNLSYNVAGEINKITTCAWINTSSSSRQTIVDYDRSEYWSLGINFHNAPEDIGKISWDTRGEGSAIHDMASSVRVDDGQWHHVCGVFDASQVNDKKIYVDGVLDSQSDAYSTNVKLGNGVTRYGYIGDGSEADIFNGRRNGIYFKGSIDDVRVYNDALSSSEISDIIQLVSPPQTNEPPVANDQSSLTINMNGTLPITLTGNDADNDVLTYSIVTFPTNGKISGTAPELMYTPNVDYLGKDNFIFKVNDGKLDSNVAVVNIDVVAGTIASTSFVRNIKYNVNGQITQIEYGNGVITSNTYDPLNLRLLQVKTSSTDNSVLQDFSYTYDAVGNVGSIVDNIHTATQNFQYDALSRLTQAVGEAYGTKTYSYDTIGNIIQKDGFTYTYGQNSAGPHAVTSRTDGATTEIYTYDANGNMTAKIKNGVSINYTYDIGNLLTEVKKAGVLIAQYKYDGDGGRTKKVTFENGVGHGTPSGNNTCFLAGTPVLMADGRTKSIEEIQIGDAVMSFNERTGEKVISTVTNFFNGEFADEYLIINDTLRVTDNHQFYSQGEWREIGKLSVEDKLLSLDLTDASIEKIEKITTQSAVRVYNIEVDQHHNYFAGGYLVHNKMSFFNMTSNDTSTTTETIYIGTMYEETNNRPIQYIFLGDTRIASVSWNKVLYYHSDHLGGTNILTDDTGTKKELIEYLPYGGFATHEKYGNDQETALYYFTGKPFDDEAGLYYYGARYYDPSIGRFITSDTIVPYPENPQTFNRYTYVHNNPINLVDPSGNFALFSFFAGLFKSAFFGSLIGGATAAATGGDIGDGFLTGAISGLIFGGIGDLGLSGSAQISAHTIGGAISGGINTTILGGDPGISALIGGVSAGVAQLAGQRIPFLQTTTNDTFSQFSGNFARRSIVGAVIGGSLSSVTGGNFGDGAKLGGVSAAIGFVANDSFHPGGYLNKKYELIVHKFYNVIGSWVGDSHIQTVKVGNWKNVGTIQAPGLTSLSAGIYRAEYHRETTYRQNGHFKTYFGNTKSFTRTWNELDVGSAWIQQTNFRNGNISQRTSPITEGRLLGGRVLQR